MSRHDLAFTSPDRKGDITVPELVEFNRPCIGGEGIELLTFLPMPPDYSVHFTMFLWATCNLIRRFTDPSKVGSVE